MAADWIAIRIGINDDPDVIAIAEAIGRREDEVVGMLVRFWAWADQNVTPENDNRDAHSVTVSVTKKWIDRHIGVTGFADALESRRWIEVDGDGLRIPRFGRYMGKSGKTRLKTARRNSAMRKRDANRDAHSVTKSTETASPTEEKRREELKGLSNDKPSGVSEGRSRKPSRAELDAAEPIYQAYPRHIAKPKGLEAIAKALRRVPFDDLMAAVQEYAKSRQGKDPNLTPYPASWFNAERWNDDRAEWHRPERPKPGERPPDAWRDIQAASAGDGPRTF